MACQILISNTCSVAKGEIISLFSGDHVFGWGETMKEWTSSGRGKPDWPRVFSVVIVTDKEKAEMDYLLDTLPNGNNKYHFIEPPQDSPFYLGLLNEGEVSVLYDDLPPYLMER